MRFFCTCVYSINWCANECGYIQADVLPNTAGCVVGESCFRACDQWQEASYIPNLGDIIYFDWDKAETNGQDGITNHVGIVEKTDNGYIYTVGGNSGDRASNNTWAVGHYEIYGYGVPIY